MKVPSIQNKSNLFGYSSAVLSAAFFGSISTISKSILCTTINPLLLSSLVYLVAALYGMQKLAQNVTGVKVPLSGHWTPEERPDLVNMLNNFFNGKPTSENQ